MKTRMAALVLSLVFLTGCASLLDREYNTVEPHSSKFWESEAANTLRAETYQDLVNDLLILIGQHQESATVRLYNFEDDLTVTDTVERAAVEVQKETPLGAYAVEYITSTTQAQRGYYEINLQIGYRRTLEQIQTVVSATSAEAVYSLLESALNVGRTELAVRVGYWGTNSREQIDEAIRQLRADLNLTDGPEWGVYYYPGGGEVGLVEILLEPTEEMLQGSWVSDETSVQEILGLETENANENESVTDAEMPSAAEEETTEKEN